MTAPRRWSLLLLPLLLAGCANLLDRRVETAVRDALPRVLGPAARYDVAVSGADGASAERVSVVAVRLARADAPVIDRVDLDLRNVVVDREAKALRGVEAVDARARVLAADLAGWLRQRGLDDATVRLDAPDRIAVAGTPRIGPFPLPLAGGAELRGRVVASGTQLRLVIDALRIGPADAPPLARALLQGLVNPVLDVAPYPLPARIDAVAVDGGDALVVSASGSRLPPPSRPGS